MFINLRTIPYGPRSFEFSLKKDRWRPDEKNNPILALDTPLHVKVEIHEAGDKYVLDGALSGTVQVRCDRCLDPYQRDLNSEFRVLMALPLSETDKEEEELIEEDMEVHFLRGEEVDLDEIIQEQVYLSLPIIRFLCKENCQGLCPVCGNNLNKENCQCNREHGHPGFLKLKNLRIKGE